MCHVLKLNRSSFYKWVNTHENRRLKICSDALIGARIKAIFDDENGLYGAKRIAASLNDDTDFGPINHKKVARIMKSMGLKGFSKRRRCITTRRKPGHRVMPDLVGRTFTADEPNRVYVGDITYLPCKGGKNMYLATVIDTYSGPDPRKVDTSGVSYAALVSVAEVSASKTSGAERLHQECRRRVL